MAKSYGSSWVYLAQTLAGFQFVKNLFIGGQRISYLIQAVQIQLLSSVNFMKSVPS